MHSDASPLRFTTDEQEDDKIVEGKSSSKDTENLGVGNLFKKYGPRMATSFWDQH